MAAELLALAGDAARRRAVGLAAADKVRGAFTVGHMARAYERVYEELVSL
jgi:hypothetical protein